jgi:hypothetical protein
MPLRQNLQPQPVQPTARRSETMDEVAGRTMIAASSRPPCDACDATGKQIRELYEWVKNRFVHDTMAERMLDFWPWLSEEE